MYSLQSNALKSAVFTTAKVLQPIGLKVNSGNGSTVDLGATSNNIRTHSTIHTSSRAGSPFIAGATVDSEPTLNLEHSDDGSSWSVAGPLMDAPSLMPRSAFKDFLSTKRYVRLAWSIESTCSVTISADIATP